MEQDYEGIPECCEMIQQYRLLFNSQHACSKTWFNRKLKGSLKLSKCKRLVRKILSLLSLVKTLREKSITTQQRRDKLLSQDAICQNLKKESPKRK